MRPRMVVKTGNQTYLQTAWHVGFAITKFNFYPDSTEQLAEPEVQRYRPFSTFSHRLGPLRSLS